MAQQDKTPGQEQKNAARPESSEAGRAPAGKPPRKKWSRRRKVLTVAGITLGALVLVLGIGFFTMYQVVADQISGVKTEAGTLPEEVKTLPEYTGAGIVCGLVCGLDYDNENADGYEDEKEKVGRTDVILYFIYDTEKNKLNILQLPRDTFVGEEVETGGYGKINGVYYYAEDTNNRMSALATVVKEQLGLPVDLYITIDMDAVKEIIDIKGSIEVYVPMDVIDPEHPEAMIPAGWQHFSSEQAEFYLRNRTSPNYNDQGDIMRLQMQQSFYSALFREFEALSPWDLVMWMKVLLWRVDTDMDPMQLGGLAQKALNLTGEDITFVRPPMTGAKYGPHSLLCLVPEETAELLNEYFRPEGQVLALDELDIRTLPVDELIGYVEPNIRSMAAIRATEPAEGGSGSVLPAPEASTSAAPAA